jgi:arylsulfatase A-like enzyme
MKKAGAKTDALVEFVDIYPTLTDLAGLSAPSTLEGTSLRPLLDDPTLPWKTSAFSQYPRSEKGGLKLMGYSMRTDRYRFTVWIDQSGGDKVHGTELYDHQVDPQENTNIAGLPANRKLVDELMSQWQKGWRGAKPASVTKS